MGAPTELLDESGGIAWRTRSTLWGTTTWNADATAYTPLRFPGQYADPETGLHYNFHRHYDPTTARYLSQDPLGLDLSPNPVTYVHNPHVGIDPLGLQSCEVFPNQMPGTLERELALADRLGVSPSSVGSPEFDAPINSGTIKWAVREDGNLVTMPKFVDGQEISHAALTRGDPVRAAGEADIAGSPEAGYFGLDINNHSGHSRPSSKGLQVGRDEFAAAGVQF